MSGTGCRNAGLQVGDAGVAGWGCERCRMGTRGMQDENAAVSGWNVRLSECKGRVARMGIRGFRMGLMLCTKASFVLGRLLRFGNGALRSEHRKIETSALSAADFQFQQLLHLERMKMHSGLVGVN